MSCTSTTQPLLPLPVWIREFSFRLYMSTPDPSNRSQFSQHRWVRESKFVIPSSSPTAFYFCFPSSYNINANDTKQVKTWSQCAISLVKLPSDIKKKPSPWTNIVKILAISSKKHCFRVQSDRPGRLTCIYMFCAKQFIVHPHAAGIRMGFLPAGVVGNESEMIIRTGSGWSSGIV